MNGVPVQLEFCHSVHPGRRASPVNAHPHGATVAKEASYRKLLALESDVIYIVTHLIVKGFVDEGLYLVEVQM